jgi:hypothetical protein
MREPVNFLRNGKVGTGYYVRGADPIEVSRNVVVLGRHRLATGKGKMDRL